MNFDGISYAKGAAALRQLWAWIGEDAFFAGVRRYLDRHAWGNTSLADLLAALEEESGRDLAAWSSLVAARRPGRRRSGCATVCWRATTTGRTSWASGATPGRPAAPGRAARRRGARLAAADRACRPGAAQRRRPHLRQGAARRALAGDRADLAAHPGRPGRQVAGLGVAVGRRPRRRAARRTTTSGSCSPTSRGRRTPTWSARSSARPASPPSCGPAPPSSWPACTSTRSRSRPSPAATCSSPSTGPPWRPRPATWTCPTGFPRTRSCAGSGCAGWPSSGRCSSDELAATYAAEPTSTAQNHLAYASAALPDPAAKGAAWAELTGAGDLSTSRARALGQGFWRPGQDDLVADYVERYVADVPGIWRRRSPELAAVLTGSALPVDHRLAVGGRAHRRPGVQRTPTPGQRRVVLECRDDLARAVACRALAW